MKPCSIERGFYYGRIISVVIAELGIALIGIVVLFAGLGVFGRL